MPKFKYTLYRLSPHKAWEVIDVFTNRRDASRSIRFYRKNDCTYNMYKLEYIP